MSTIGSAGIRYNWKWADAVIAEVTNTDEVASLVYTTHMGAPLQPPLLTANAKRENFLDEGLWWKRDPGVIPYLFLVSVTPRTAIAQVSVAGSTTDPPATEEVQLSAHETKLYSLQPLISQFPHPVKEGGVSINYSGVSRPIVLEGALENEATGYSLTFPVIPMSARTARNLAMTGQIKNLAMTDQIHYASVGIQVKYASVGVQVGIPKPYMNFAEGTTFIPYATLRNLSTKPILINSAVVPSNGPSENVNLPPLLLAPHETHQLDLSKMLATASSRHETEENLVFSYDGQAGDVLIATGSTAKDGNYVFDVDPQLENEIHGEVQSSWRMDSTFDTMVSFWNTGDKAEDDMFELDYGLGTYQIPIRLEANASSSLDVGELLKKSVPDVKGKVIPPSITRGIARLRPTTSLRATMNTRMQLSVLSPQFSICQVPCPICGGLESLDLDPTLGVFDVGGTPQYTATATWHNGTTTNVNAVSTWSSANAGIASISSTTPGLATGVSPGTTNISAKYQDTGYLYGPGSICYKTSPGCPPVVGQPSQPVTVQLPTNSRLVL